MAADSSMYGAERTLAGFRSKVTLDYLLASDDHCADADADDQGAPTGLLQVVALDALAFPGAAWGLHGFNRRLWGQECFARVAWYEGHPVGYLVAGITSDGYRVLRLATATPCRRRGVASVLLGELKTAAVRRHALGLTALVPEADLEAQLFLKNQGFLWVRTVRRKAGGVRYRMEWAAFLSDEVVIGTRG